MTVHPPALKTAVSTSPCLEQQLVDIETQYVQQHRFLDALQHLTVLAHQNLTEPRVWLLIGFVYTRMAHWKHAISALETVLQLEPKDGQAKQLLSLALFSTGQQEQACKLIDQVVKQKTANSAQWMLRAFLHAHTYKDSMHAFTVARDWGKRFADPLTRAAKPLLVKDRDPRKKLKVGYVTADFREHSVAFFMQPVLAHHTPESVEIHVYSNGPTDHVTEQLKSLVPYWYDVVGLSDDELHAKIRCDGIDILVDLSGFTHGQRLLVFARRAAPVQVTWLGYMHTLGMKAIDYRLVGIDTQHLQLEKFHSETLFYLQGLICYAPPAYAPLCEVPPIARNKYPTLVSLNNSAKISDEILHLWAKILCKCDDARLIILVKEDSAEAAQAHMQPRVEAAGMPLERVLVLPQLSINQFMEIGHIADIALDTSPISGGTTSLHALWMGMPIVTLDAERDAEAATARILKSLGMGGVIAKNADEYVNGALNLMANSEHLRQQRLVLRDRLRNSYLMDYGVRIAEMEKAYRLMWLNYLREDRKARNVNVELEPLFQAVS